MQRGVLNVNSYTWNAQKTKTLLYSLIICYTATQTYAQPVSIAEINGKSGKNIASASPAATLLIKPSPQDAQLNSLNAYATNYGHFAAQYASNAATAGNTNANTDSSSSSSSSSTNSQMNNNHFKASFKLPDIENNFTPLQTYNNGNNMPYAAPLTTIAATPNANNNNNNLPQATPVLMQYLPHALPETGVHYLQLIPTRPLIVPISPSYLNGNAPPAVAQNAVNAATHALHPPLAAAINAAPMDYGARSQPLLAPEPINSQQQHAVPLANFLDISNAAPPPPYGIHTYANSLQPYRNSYRINREVKGKNFPGTMTLNMNEYIPGPNETLRPLYMRGRP